MNTHDAVECHPIESRSNRRPTLAERQSALVSALVSGGPPPPGFDVDRLKATENALLRKRCGEAARRLPQVRAQLGTRFDDAFVAWARGRAPAGSSYDAQGFIAHLIDTGLWSPPRARRRILRRSRGK
ncbi:MULTISPECIES: hypothetical protein [Gordonia]|uniref:hypothetical protein n=1 Tax=Gordonia TaxID=2053 RepID=UPI00068F57BC|nr:MULTISPECIES: hypothetical protein [Gordonia]NKY91995.1 hypothetical protein [Gordonia sputi]OBC01554.1 hypothetical protein A5785_17880 [Gordonia sp. 852002-50395_SCH5434458]